MNKQTSGARQPDNNKRLAALETSVSALAIALAANGVDVGDGDLFETTIARIKHAGLLDAELVSLIGASTSVIARFAPDMELAPIDEQESLMALQTRLLGQLATAETPCDRKIRELEDQLGAANARIENVDAQLAAEREIMHRQSGELEGLKAKSAEEANDGALDALKARVGALENEKVELEEELVEATSEKNRLANELAAANEGRPIVQAAEEAAEEAPPAPIMRERCELARDVGPDAGTYAPEELAELLTSESGPVGLELAFSNGAYEIVSLAPVPIGSNGLQSAEGRFMVSSPVFTKLLATDVSERLHGVGLLMGGEQIAYCALTETLLLEPGTERRFERAIYF